MTRARQWRVDAIEEGIARIERLGDDGEATVDAPLHLPLSLLPHDVREDDILAVSIAHDEDARSVRLTIVHDRAATERALARSIEQLKGLKPGGRGDVQL